MGIELPLQRHQATYSMKRKKTPPPPSVSVPQQTAEPSPEPTSRAPEDDTQSSAPLPPPVADSSLHGMIREIIRAELAPITSQVDSLSTQVSSLVRHANEQSTALSAISSALTLFAQAMDSIRGTSSGATHQIPVPSPIPPSEPSSRPLVGHITSPSSDPTEPLHVIFSPLPPHTDIPSSSIPPLTDPLTDHTPDTPIDTDPIIQPASHPSSPVASHHSSSADEEIVVEVSSDSHTDPRPPLSHTAPIPPPLNLPDPEPSGGSSAQYRDDFDMDEATSAAVETLVSMIEPVLLLTYPGYPAPEDDAKKGESSSDSSDASAIAVDPVSASAGPSASASGSGSDFSDPTDPRPPPPMP